jgi:hypothetical protein
LGCRQTESEEALNVLGGTERVDGGKAELEQEVIEVAVAAGLAHLRFPVVVEGFDASGWRVMLAENDNP